MWLYASIFIRSPLLTSQCRPRMTKSGSYGISSIPCGYCRYMCTGVVREFQPTVYTYTVSVKLWTPILSSVIARHVHCSRAVQCNRHVHCTPFCPVWVSSVTCTQHKPKQHLMVHVHVLYNIHHLQGRHTDIIYVYLLLMLNYTGLRRGNEKDKLPSGGKPRYNDQQTSTLDTEPQSPDKVLSPHSLL